VFANPCDRKTLERLVARACDLKCSAPGRVSFVTLLTDVVLFAELPPADLRDVVRPALTRAIEELDKQGARDKGEAGLLANTRRCLWNLDYALAASDFEALRREGKDASNAPAKLRIQHLERQAMELPASARVPYVGDLTTWHLRADTETASARIAELVKVDRNHWRVMVAQEEVRLRRQLARCETDDQRAALLVKASRDPNNPIPLQGWAVRRLADCPTDGAVKFLRDLYDNVADTSRRQDLALEAQEALRRLKRIPHDQWRYHSAP